MTDPARPEDASALDADALAPYLERHVPGFRGLREIVKFKDGQSNPTFRIVADSGRYVLRAKPPGELLKSAHQVDREYRVMSALAKTDVPVPKMLHLSPEDSPIGRMFYVMEHLDGRVLWDPALPDFSSDERAALYDAMNDTLAKLHSVDVDAVGLSDFGKPGSYFARQLGRWSKQYKASEVDPIPDMDALIEWLEARLPEDDGQVSLVHGDYRMDNMMFATDEIRVIGVLDWELSTLGHPLADVAYQCMQWRLPHEGGFRGLGGVDRKALGIPTEEEYLARYCERRNVARVEHWTFYVAFCFFRIAAILQGVYKRALDGNASNPERAMQMGRSVPLIARIAIEMIEEEG